MITTSSRLELFCEKFIQAGWLVALVTAPLFFNIYSSRVFEPDKIVLIRSLALVMSLAWLVARTERGRVRGAEPEPGRSLRERFEASLRKLSGENPLAVPTLLLVGAYILSSLISVSPAVSFFGSYQRQQGLYTFASYVVIFFMAASLIRTRAEVERAVSVALVTSFPVAFYGIIQHYFLDPLPWIGDVTTRVASTLGNSIFIGSYLILTIPLALARLVQTSARAAQGFPRGPARTAFTLAAIVTVLVVAGVWSASFDLGARALIEENFAGKLTPEQLQAASRAFAVALSLSVAVLAAWWAAAFILRKRSADLVLTGVYALLLAVELVALLFSQSRGPLLGLLGGLFCFGVLWALARGAHRLAIGSVSLAAVVLVMLVLINIPGSPLSALKDLPYVGRLGRVFELEGGTGRVRVLIWQGALKMFLPHAPLWSPTTGDDPVNPIRPLVGYGPETMYVAYNPFYPAELGTLESRSATPDRSHNETFDALVTTGVLGFVAENLLFLSTFYLALKWLGLVPSRRMRNLFVGLWYGGGLLLAAAFSFVLGPEFIGVALPAGMILGMFVYLIALVTRARPEQTVAPGDALWFSALLALVVSHFIEIHFGIAIVATRVYFWFFAAVLVAVGTRGLRVGAELEEAQAPPVRAGVEPARSHAPGDRGRARRNRAVTPTVPKASPKPETVSSAPLITFAFLTGFVLAVMGFDFINTNNLSALGSGNLSGLDIVASALTFKNTTAGGMASAAMLWLFMLTGLVAIGIGAGEWGRRVRLPAREWLVAVGLFVIVAFAIFSGLALYHVLLIATQGAAILEAVLTDVVLFCVFMLAIVGVVALTLLFDESLSPVWVRRATNVVVLPVLILLAGLGIIATNIDPVRADMLYKQGASLPPESASTAIDLYKRALALQPGQDYYLLFLGRAYLDAAKSAQDAPTREQSLKDAAQALLKAREINPYNTDHSANLARLAQARGGLASEPAARVEAYKEAADYFRDATRLSPNTPHLYDQHAQALLEYAQLLEQNQDVTGAANVRGQARAQIDDALKLDPTFCLTFAVRAQAQQDWRARAQDALKAIEYAPKCGDTIVGEALATAVEALSRAGDEAAAAGASGDLEAMLKTESEAHPMLEVFTTLANLYSKAGQIPEAITAIDGAIKLIPASDSATQKRYEDFRYTLVQLEQALEAAAATPDNPEVQRKLAEQWLARGQSEYALPVYQRVVRVKPDDYPAQRAVALLLIATNQWDKAGPELTRAQELAPTAEQSLWETLTTMLAEIQSGNTATTAARVQELSKGVSAQDYALINALRALTTRLTPAG